MKLRIRGSSLRLRLDRLELELLVSAGLVQDTTRFGPDTCLTYSLSLRAQDARLSAEFDGGNLHIFIRTDEALRLAETEMVGVQDEQDTGDSEKLRLLVEKDFSCLQERPYEDDAYAFPNPRYAHDCEPQ